MKVAVVCCVLLGLVAVSQAAVTLIKLPARELQVPHVRVVRSAQFNFPGFPGFGGFQSSNAAASAQSQNFNFGGGNPFGGGFSGSSASAQAQAGSFNFGGR